MIKLGLLLGIKNDKYPENLKSLCMRTDMFVRHLDGEDLDLTPEEAALGVRMFDVLLLNSSIQETDELETKLAQEADVHWAERYEFEIEPDEEVSQD